MVEVGFKLNATSKPCAPDPLSHVPHSLRDEEVVAPSPRTTETSSDWRRGLCWGQQEMSLRKVPDSSSSLTRKDDTPGGRTVPLAMGNGTKMAALLHFSAAAGDKTELRTRLTHSPLPERVAGSLEWHCLR